MKSFTLNREFFIRHLGVTLLMAALGCWFVYDGSVVYPKMDAVEFCEKHHKNVENAEQEKVNAIKRQYQFASLANWYCRLMAFTFSCSATVPVRVLGVHCRSRDRLPPAQGPEGDAFLG